MAPVVNPSYRLGLSIVAGTILVSLGLVMANELAGKRKPPTPIGQNLGDDGYALGSFHLTERSGKTVTDANLADDVWVAAFIFTRCPSSCPKIMGVMKGMQAPLLAAGVKLVSISVDPSYDTPAVLSKYATGLGADPNGWLFLTGDEAAIHDLILKRFHLSVGRNSAGDQEAGAEAVAHSNRLALVDRGNQVIGVFDSTETAALQDLMAQARRKASWARRLPAVNATLNGTCAVLLLLGWTMILTRRIKAHAACMIASVVVSAVFLACYLVYHYEAGSVSFRGVGPARITYLTVLLSHTILATFGVVPLVALTLVRAVRSQFQQHANIARVTFPIWFYVSVTGVVIYWMLYQMPIRTY